MDGILLIDKPKGWTSFDVVAKVRGIVRQAQISSSSQPKKIKVGHSGTLDPLATGLLVLLIGNYTKRAPELSKLDKTYEVTMQLGKVSSTGDEEGEKTSVSDMVPNKDELKAVMRQFEGAIEQVPPIYSAIKVNGQRAYKLARAGKEVNLKSREVNIHKLLLTEYSYPQIKFTTEVSSGTYIRSLVEDIGKALKAGAYMSDLRRTVVGQYGISDALDLADINYSIINTRTIKLKGTGNEKY